MPGRFVVLIALVLGLSACDSNLNPFNWFRGSSDDGVALIPEGGFPEDNDVRQLVAQVTQLEVLRASGGAIIRATGLPPRLGYWAGELVPENDERPENGVLTYQFRIAEPWGTTNTGTPQQRGVFVAHFVSDTKLLGVSRIVVLGQSNSRSSRR